MQNNTPKTALDFIAIAASYINFDSPKGRETNRIGQQNRVIDMAVQHYMSPTNSVSLLTNMPAPSRLYFADIAECTFRACHYGVAIGQPTGEWVMKFGSRNTRLTIKARVKRLFRQHARLHGVAQFA